MPNLPPLNALKAFEAAGRLGSFKRAAGELGVSPGEVSRHVALLEHWLGTPLFDRYNRRLELTPEGAAYLREVGPALHRIAAGHLVFPLAGPVLTARGYCAYVPDQLAQDPSASAFCRWLEEEGAATTRQLASGLLI